MWDLQMELYGGLVIFALYVIFDTQVRSAAILYLPPWCFAYSIACPDPEHHPVNVAVNFSGVESCCFLLSCLWGGCLFAAHR